MKYIIQRILIGVGIFLAITFLKNNVFAEVYTANNGGRVFTNVTELTTRTDFTLNDAIFQGVGHGTLYFQISTHKTSGTATSPVLSIRSVFVSNSASDYVCNIGTTDVSNSTHGDAFYSAVCPFDTALSGLTAIHIVYNYTSAGNAESYYYVAIPGITTFVSDNTTLLGGIHSRVDSIKNYSSSIDSNLSGFRTEFFNNIRVVKENQTSTTTAINNSSTATTNAINQSTTAINNASDRVNNTLTDDTTTQAESTGSGFFSNFSGSSHGISGLITSPLRLLQSFTTANCQSLTFQLPFVHNTVTLSCMRSVYTTYFPTWFTLYQMLTTGVICYMVMINIYSKLKDLQNPNNDRIEVLSL